MALTQVHIAIFIAKWYSVAPKIYWKGGKLFFQSVQLGAPPNWHDNLSGVNFIHWSQIGDFDSPDIKLIWEPQKKTIKLLEKPIE